MAIMIPSHVSSRHSSYQPYILGMCQARNCKWSTKWVPLIPILIVPQPQDISPPNSMLLTLHLRDKLYESQKGTGYIHSPCNRLLFTKHRLHLNKSGKALLSNQLVLHILSTLEKVSSNPIPLRWYDKKQQVSVPPWLPLHQPLPRVSCQLGKHPNTLRNCQ